MKILSTSIFFFFIFTFFTHAQLPNVSIHIQSPQKNNAVAYLIISNLISGGDTVARTSLNAQGDGSLNFHLNQPTFAELTIEKFQFTCFFSPDDNLKVIVETNDKTTSTQFSGKGAEANNYLEESRNVFNKHFNVGGKQINEFAPEEFTHSLNKMKSALDEFHQSFIQKYPLPEKTSKLLGISNRIIPLSFKHNYISARYNTTEGRMSIPEFLEKVYGEIPLDDDFLNAKYSYYGWVLKEYYDNLCFALLAQKTPDGKKIPYAAFPKMFERMIKNGNYSKAMTECLLAINIYDALNQGLTSGTMSVYDSFKKEYPHSPYQLPLDKKYQKWITISKGAPAPNFTGVTPDGKKVSLSDLKGKIVYADIWATWCGPCVEELPKAKEIQQKFSEKDDVVFLYVSIDSKSTNWKNFLEKDPAFKGTHINISDDTEVSKLYKAYQMSGVPAYFLIDKEGKIITATASRPSSGKVEGEIRALVK